MLSATVKSTHASVWCAKDAQILVEEDHVLYSSISVGCILSDDVTWDVTRTSYIHTHHWLSVIYETSPASVSSSTGSESSGYRTGLYLKKEVGIATELFRLT